MVTKHTPGVWTAQVGTTTGREVVSSHATKARRIVARCGGPDRQANAALIAAAPCLLEALEYLVSKPHGEQIHDAFDMAHRALAKARGE